MTNKPIHDLSDEEVDRALAELRGWMVENVSDYGGYRHSNLLKPSGDIFNSHLASEDRAWELAPRPTTDPTDNLELREWFLRAHHNRPEEITTYYSKKYDTFRTQLLMAGEVEEGRTLLSAEARAILAAMRAESTAMTGGCEEAE